MACDGWRWGGSGEGGGESEVKGEGEDAGAGAGAGEDEGEGQGEGEGVVAHLPQLSACRGDRRQGSSGWARRPAACSASNCSLRTMGREHVLRRSVG